MAGTRVQQSILGRGLVDGVADPRVPSGLDLGGVVVVLGVLNPARSEGQFLVVLKELVARAIGTDETTVLGVTCAGQRESRIVRIGTYRCTIRSKQTSLVKLEWFGGRHIPATVGSNPTQGQH